MERRLFAADSTAAGITPAAFRAVRYADWTDGVVCRLPQAASMRPMPHSVRLHVAARASVRLPQAASYLITDTNNAPVYAPQRMPAAPAFEAWQADVLAAIRCMRRWQYRDTPALPAPAANEPVDSCPHCLTQGAQRKAWQAANRLRLQGEIAREAALQRTQRARLRHSERLRQRLSE